MKVKSKRNIYIGFSAGSILLLMILLLLGGCASSETELPDEDFSNADFSLERIDSFLENGEHLKALPLILAREREGYPAEDLYSTAIIGLKAEWNAARADGDWRRSLAYLRSFRVLGEEIPGNSVTETDLFIEGIDQFINDGLTGGAAALIQSGPDIGSIPDDKKKEWAEVFAASGHSSVAALLGGEEIPDTPDMAALIDGTVTVWVNRGIRLVGNVGVPDRGIGSGFFIDPEGYILTNYHVIDSEVDPSYQGYSRLFIKIDEDSADRIPARVVGYDKNFDLALLKTEMDVSHVFSFAGEGIPQLGERISAIGSPGGLAKTLTSGTVSAYARSIQPMAGSLQIDVPINPGNSGGPLMNSRGEVIGIVFAGVESYEGVNFAIPGGYVKQLVPSLYEGGAVEIPWFGVSAWDTSRTIEVTYIVPGSPAADASLKTGDIITGIDGRQFKSITNIQEYMITRDAGTLAELSWTRDGVAFKGIAALGVRPDVPLRTALTRDAREHLLTPLFGFTLERISGSGLSQNYRVVDVLPGSIADEAGFTPGDTFSLRKWIHDEEYDVVIIQMVLKGRKAGFLESPMQIGARLETSKIF